jgi:hypothetical protein
MILTIITASALAILVVAVLWPRKRVGPPSRMERELAAVAEAMRGTTHPRG